MEGISPHLEAVLRRTSRAWRCEGFDILMLQPQKSDGSTPPKFCYLVWIAIKKTCRHVPFQSISVNSENSDFSASFFAIGPTIPGFRWPLFRSLSWESPWRWRRRAGGKGTTWKSRREAKGWFLQQHVLSNKEPWWWFHHETWRLT